MAHSKSTRDTALQLFIQGTPIEKIAAEMKIPLKTVYNWKARHDWNSFLRVGNLEIARDVEAELYKLVKKMIENESIGDPAQVDKLAKLTKALERLAPNRQILNSLYHILEGITDYVNRIGDPDLTRSWQKHLKPLSEHLRSLFAPKALQ